MVLGSHNLSEKLYFFYDYLPKSPVPTEWAYDADREVWTLDFETRNQGKNNTSISVFSPSTGQSFCLLIPRERLLNSRALISMTPSKAAANDKKIELAFGGHLAEPFLAGTDPGECLYFNLEDIVGVNTVTGEYWKASFDATVPEQKNPQSGVTPIRSHAPDTIASVWSLYGTGKDDEEAKVMLSRILERRPNESEALLILGKILTRQGDSTEALPPLHSVEL